MEDAIEKPLGEVHRFYHITIEFDPITAEFDPITVEFEHTNVSLQRKAL